jgi:hypothetical protein
LLGEPEMLGYLLGTGLKGTVEVFLVLAVLALVALLRCRREDIPATVRELGPWWRPWRGRK